MHKTCEGCQFNKYPICEGTILESGEYMRIDNLKPSFTCGVKERGIPEDHSIKIKSDLEVKVEELETRIENLEGGG